MPTDFREVIQQTLYSTLSAGLSVDVFDYVPDEPEGLPSDSFPFVTVGDQELSPFDHDDRLGVYSVATLHVWSRYKGSSEVNRLLDEIYGLLHRASLSAAGVRFVDCLFQYSTRYVEEDGQTRHGLIRFRLTVQET